MTQFSDWLEDAMFERGGRKYRQVNLAHDIGIQEATVSDWVNEKKTPGRDNIYKLAIHFATTSRHIYELLEETPPDGLNDEEELLTGLIHQIPPGSLGADKLMVILQNWGKLSDEKRIDLMQRSASGGDPGAAPAKPVVKAARKRSG